MKKQRKDEIVSLNQGLFSLDAGNLSIETLDQRLELAIAVFDPYQCEDFSCTHFSSCTDFDCVVFKIPKTDG